MATNYATLIRELNENMLNEIRELVNGNGGALNVPFYYNEDYYDDDVEELIEDEYDVREGDEEDNVRVSLETAYDHNSEIEVIGFTLGNCYNKNAVMVISKDQNTYEVSVDENPIMVNYLLEVAREVCE